MHWTAIKVYKISKIWSQGMCRWVCVKKLLRVQLMCEEVRFDPLNYFYFCLLNFSFSQSTRSNNVCFLVHIYSQPDCQVLLGCSKLLIKPSLLCPLHIHLSPKLWHGKGAKFSKYVLHRMVLFPLGKPWGKKPVLTEHARCRNGHIHCCAAGKQAVWCPGQEGGGSLWYSLFFLLRKAIKNIPWAIQWNIHTGVLF